MEDFILYQANPTKQLLLYDLATSSSVLAFLKMKDIPTSIKNLTNTEFMSENGRMPVVVDKSSDKLMCGFTEVFWYVTRMLQESPDMMELAYMDWIETNFLEAEMYITWCYEPMEAHTRTRYTYDLPWPASTILFNRKKAQIQACIGEKVKSFDDFLLKFNEFLAKLNKRIGNRNYCLGDSSPSSIDALIYGHTKAILNTVPNSLMVDAITKQRRIANLTELINKNYPSL